MPKPTATQTPGAACTTLRRNSALCSLSASGVATGTAGGGGADLPQAAIRPAAISRAMRLRRDIVLSSAAVVAARLS